MGLKKVIHEEIQDTVLDGIIDLLEGTGDRYAQKLGVPDTGAEFEKQWQKQVKTDSADAVNGKLVGKVIDRETKKPVNIYMNPRSLENFGNGVRAISDNEGNIYVAQQDEFFIHEEMGNAIGLHKVNDVNKYITWHRFHNTNKFNFAYNFGQYFDKLMAHDHDRTLSRFEILNQKQPFDFIIMPYDMEEGAEEEIVVERQDMEKIDEINALKKEVDDKLKRKDFSEIKRADKGDLLIAIINISGDQHVLEISFTNIIKRGTSGDYGMDKDSGEPFINIFDCDVIDDGGNNVEVYYNENTLSHELRHYLDWQRGNDVFGQKYNTADGDKSSYYNNPAEYNAFMIQHLRQYFNQFGIRYIKDDFNLFYNGLVNHTKIDEYKDKLNPDMRKKFMNRLYAFHQRLIEERDKQYPPKAVAEGVGDTYVNEIGEANVSPYAYRQTAKADSMIQYGFDAGNNLRYYVYFQNIVDFGSKELTKKWHGGFEVEGLYDAASTDVNEIQKIMATITAIMLDFVQELDPSELIFEPSKTTESDMRRYNLYMAYIRKQMPSGYEVVPHDDKIVIRKTGLEEGLGDKYAEKRFGIPDNTEQDYQKQTAPAVRSDDMGEMVAYAKIGPYSNRQLDVNEPIFKNPKNLSKFEAYVRALSDVDGNLYVAQYNGDFVHGGMDGVMPGKEVYSLQNGLTWHRIKETNKFGLSDSAAKYIEWDREDIQKDFLARLDAVKRVNPMLQFLPQMYFNVNEIIQEEVKRLFTDSFYEEQEQSENVQAWHGSPHDFDTFDTQHMSSGEGAQHFGWGLYFTDIESIATQYSKMNQDILSIADYIYGNRYTRENVEGLERLSNEELIAAIKKTYDFKVKKIHDRAEAKRAENESYPDGFVEHLIQTQDNLSQRYIASVQSTNPTKYQVSLHKGKTPDQYEWLEWDKPIPDAQLEKILTQVKKEYGEGLEDYDGKPISELFELPAVRYGGIAYRTLSRAIKSDKEVSMLLLRVGIDGIKYPAESISRGMTSDTARGFNYVVFDPNAVSIENKFSTGSQNTVADVVHEEVAGFLEGYSSYEEKQEFEKLYQQRLKSKDQSQENGELAGRVRVGDDPSDLVNIYKNPKSLKNFESGVRAVADEQGNIYVAQLDKDFFHTNIAAAVFNGNGDSHQDFYRAGKSNMFGTAGGYIYNKFASQFLSDRGGVTTSDILDDILADDHVRKLFTALNKYPDVQFNVLGVSGIQHGDYTAQDIERGLITTATPVPQGQNMDYFEEGVGDKYAEKRFGIPDADKEFNKQGVPDADMGEQMTPIWASNYKKENSFYGYIYKNPKTLKGFDVDVRALADTEGNLYVAQQDGDFIHTDMEMSLEKKIGFYDDFIELHRAGDSNTFGISDTLHHTMEEYGVDPYPYYRVLEKRFPQYRFSLDYYQELREGVGDKYAQKAAGVPDAGEMFDNQYQAHLKSQEQHDPSMGEKVLEFDTEVSVKSESGKHTSVPAKAKIFKNPKSLNGFESGVRAISTKHGDLYVANINGYFTHAELAQGLFNDSPYQIQRYVTWYRDGNANGFELASISEDMFYRLMKGQYSDNIFDMFWKGIEQLKTKNPDFKFPEVENQMPDNVAEGLGDKYAQKAAGVPDAGEEFEKRWQTHRKTQEKDVENGELVGHVYSTEDYDDYQDEPVNIYKNPKSLKNFGKYVRAVADNEGNLYVSQHDKNFYHENIMEVVPSITDYKNAVQLYRVGDTNLFGTAGTYLRQVFNTNDITDTMSKVHIDEHPEIKETFKRLNNKHHQYEFSYYPTYLLWGNRLPAEQIRDSILKEGMAVGDNSGYMQMVDEVIAEEIQNIHEEYDGGTLYGYHCTPCENLDSIEAQGFKIGPGQMQGKGIYAFFNLSDNSAGNAAVGYGQRHVGRDEFCVVKFQINYPQHLLILNKDVAEEVLGDQADIVTQIDKHFNGWENYWEKIERTLKQEYRTPEYEEEFKAKLRQDFDNDYSKNLMFGTSNLEGLASFGTIYDGEYGLQFLIKSPNIMIPIGYHKVGRGNDYVLKPSEYVAFRNKAKKIRTEILTNDRYADLRDIMYDIETTDDLVSMRARYVEKQNVVRNNREYDMLGHYIELFDELIAGNSDSLSEMVQEEPQEEQAYNKIIQYLSTDLKDKTANLDAGNGHVYVFRRVGKDEIDSVLNGNAPGKFWSSRAEYHHDYVMVSKDTRDKSWESQLEFYNMRPSYDENGRAMYDEDDKLIYEPNPDYRQPDKYVDNFNDLGRRSLNDIDFIFKTEPYKTPELIYPENALPKSETSLNGIVREEILKLEGLGDKYAEKKWGIPNPDTSYQQQTQPAIRGDENGELVGYALDTSYDKKEADTRNPIYKNPRSLRNFEAGVRAVSDPQGNIWVGQTNGNYLHGDMKAAIKVIPDIYYWKNAITWNRVGATNKFGLSETSASFVQVDSPRIQEGFKANLAAVQRQHQGFEFDVEYQEEFNEGLGDKYAEKKYGSKHVDPELNDNFWKWFGNSKVLDYRGQPMVCYHQTKEDFSAFKPGGGGTWSGKAMWFGTAENRKALPAYGSKPSQEGASVMPVYLKIENPLMILTREEYLLVLEDLKISKRGWSPENDFPLIITDKQLAFLREYGHDGVMFSHRVMDDKVNALQRFNAEEIIVLDPDQIKSVYNNGTWGADDDIMNETIKLLKQVLN